MDYLEFRTYKLVNGRFYNLFLHWYTNERTINFFFFLVVKVFINFPEPDPSPTNNLMEYYHCQ